MTKKSPWPLVVALAATGISIAWAATASASSGRQSTLAPRGSAYTGIHVFGWGFDSPDAMAVSGSDLFVANRYGNSVTELDASTGCLCG